VEWNSLYCLTSRDAAHAEGPTKMAADPLRREPECRSVIGQIQDGMSAKLRAQCAAIGEIPTATEGFKTENRDGPGFRVFTEIDDCLVSAAVAGGPLWCLPLRKRVRPDLQWIRLHSGSHYNCGMFTRIVETGDLFSVILVADPDKRNFRAFSFPLEPDKLYMGTRFRDTQALSAVYVEYSSVEVAYFTGNELEEVQGVGLRLTLAKPASEPKTADLKTADLKPPTPQAPELQAPEPQAPEPQAPAPQTAEKPAADEITNAPASS
jgi:hypothetical protein